MNKQQLRRQAIFSLVGAFVFGTVTSGASRIFATTFGAEQVWPLTIVLWIAMIAIAVIVAFGARRLRMQQPNTSTREEGGDDAQLHEQ